MERLMNDESSEPRLRGIVLSSMGPIVLSSDNLLALDGHAISYSQRVVVRLAVLGRCLPCETQTVVHGVGHHRRTCRQYVS